MKRIALILLVIKVICISIDPEHDVFRPISEYQTASFAYLGNVFVGLLVVASGLGAYHQFSGVGVHIEADSLNQAGKQIAVLLYLLVLTCLLFALLMSPIHHGLRHIVLAVSAMAGYSAYLFVISIAFRDWLLTANGIAMLGLCVVPVFDRKAFGVVENLLLVFLLLGFIRFYGRTLQRDIANARPQKKPKRRIRVVK